MQDKMNDQYHDSESLPIDYVLAYEVNQKDGEEERNAFQEALTRNGLILKQEVVDSMCFITITAPFERLCKEAERCGLNMPINGCIVEPSQPTCCVALSKCFITDDQVDYISEPFQRKLCHLFADYDTKHFFRTALRSLLVHQILLDIDISERIGEDDSMKDVELKKRGLLYLAMKGAYSTTFILHDPSKDEDYYQEMRENNFMEYCAFAEGLHGDARRTLSEQWIPFYKFQPIHRIRNYFGEMITFYFAWEGTFLTALWPAAAVGLLCFIYGIVHSVNVNKTNFGECPAVDQFGKPVTSNCTFTQIMQKIANLCLKAFDNVLNPSFAIFISIWGTVFSQVWIRNRSVLAYQWSVQDYVHSEPDRPEFFGTQREKDPITGRDEWVYPQSRLYFKQCISAALVLVCMLVAVSSVIAVTVYKLFASAHFGCTHIKNFDLPCTLMVSVLPSLMNTFSTMMLGTVYNIIADKLTRWENHRTNSDYNSALIVKLFAFQFINNYTALFYLAFIRPEYYGLQRNGLFGLGDDYKDTCDYGTCGSLLALQLLSHMLIKPLPKFCKDVLLPYVMRMMKMLRWNNKIDAANEERETRAEEQRNNRLIREWLKPDAGDFTLGEYTEKMIQFGSIMMFAPLFPLAPLLALLIGLVDIRIDARRLLWLNRRPVAFISTNIGVWNAVVNFIQYISVITNTFIVAFTSNFCNEILTSSEKEMCTTQQRLLIALIFQNTVFASKYLIASFIPEVPSGIRLAERRKRYVNGKILETGVVPMINRKKKHKKRTVHARIREWMYGTAVVEP